MLLYLMSELVSWIFFILIVVFSIYTVIWNVFSISNEIKNYRFLKQHWSPENYFKFYCNKYYGYDIEVPTEKDIQLLKDYIEELKQK